VYVPLLMSVRWFFPPDYSEQKRQRWLWATAVGAVVGALAGIMIATPKQPIEGDKLGALNPINHSSTQQGSNSDRISESFKTEEGETLSVDADRGSIDVTVKDQGSVEVTVEREVIRASENEAAQILREHKVTMLHAGNQVRITASGFSRWGSLWALRPNLNIHYKLTVPARVNLLLQTAGGDICVNKFREEHKAELQGKVDVRTSGGGLTLARINGQVNGRTSGGNIKVIGCAGPLDVITTGGDIDLQAGWNVKAETTGGSISAEIAGPPNGAASLVTTGGNINLKIPEAVGVDLDASTMGGRISCDLPVQTQGDLGEGKLKGRINGDSSVPLVLRTNGGDIRIKRSLVKN